MEIQRNVAKENHRTGFITETNTHRTAKYCRDGEKRKISRK